MTDNEAIELVEKVTEDYPGHFHDLCYIGDYIQGLGYTTITKTVEILESLDQEDEDVKKLREYLKL